MRRSLRARWRMIVAYGGLLGVLWAAPSWSQAPPEAEAPSPAPEPGDPSPPVEPAPPEESSEAPPEEPPKEGPAPGGPKLPKQTPRPARRLPPPELISGPVVEAPASPESALELELGAEYRVRTVRIDPLDLSGEQVREVVWTEQRLRLELEAGYKGLIKLHTTVDALNGVLFGDNGTFNQDPSPISGVSLAAKRPNVTRWGVGLRPGADPLDSDSYEPQLVKAEPLEFVHAYADALLPVGLLRVGRQPQAYGAQLASHEGGRINRWGVSTMPDVTDRVLFGTKLDQAWYILRDGPAHKLNLAEDDGVFFALFHDWLTQDSVLGTADDTTQTGGALQFRAPTAQWLGLEWREVFVGLSVVHLGNERFASDAWGFPFKVSGQVESLGFEFQSMVVRGESREISEGFAALRSQEGSRQEIESLGLRGVLDYKWGPLTLTLEGDYASGDADPSPETPITMFSFARSFNIGLLLFEHLLAFESARSVAVGIENLKNLNAVSFPLTEASTEGRFTNAAAFFPQLKMDWVETGKHHLHTRAGVLMAWPADGAVDPIGTILAQDGARIEDDAVNYHGGAPGGYYGTELDLQVEWSVGGRFFWTVEGALLLPGSSLKDENGDAVPAWLVENRWTYAF